MAKTRECMTLFYEKLPLIPRPPPVQVVSSEFMSMFNKFSSSRISVRDVMDLLDKETYDMIFKTHDITVKEGGGVTCFTRRTRGEGGSEGGQSEEKIEVDRVLNDLHDFRDSNGFWTLDWVLPVHTQTSNLRKSTYTSSVRSHTPVT